MLESLPRKRGGSRCYRCRLSAVRKLVATGSVEVSRTRSYHECCLLFVLALTAAMQTWLLSSSVCLSVGCTTDSR